MVERILRLAEFEVFEKAMLGVVTDNILLYVLWIGVGPFGSSEAFGLRLFGRRKKDSCFYWLLGSQFCIVPLPNSLIFD